MIACANERARVTHRIVVADDDANHRAALEDVLSEAGYEVEAIGDGVETLAAIERRRPALLLLDLGMPRLNGFAVLDRIRANGWTFPVVVVTARHDAREAALAHGATTVLSKPLSVDAVLDAVRAVVVD